MKKGMRRGRAVALWATTMLVSVAGTSVGWRPAVAQEATQAYQFNIPAKPIRAAMNDIVRISGIDVVFAETQAASASGNPVRGSLTPAQAVATLLSGTGLSYTFTDRNTVTISDASQSNGETAPDGSIMLGTITLFGQGDLTEGSGLYTAAGSSTATGLGISAEETPQSVTIITDQRIRDQGVRTVYDALSYSAGLTSYAAGVGTDMDTLYSRGFVINNFQIDGAPASALGSRQNAVIYDRVDVVRGAAGMAAGMGSPAGTVNMMRKRPTAERQTSLSFNLDSWGRTGLSGDLSGSLNESGSIRGRLIVDLSDGGNWLDGFNTTNKTAYGITEVDLESGDLVTFGFSHQTDDSDRAIRSGHPLFYSDGSATNFDRSTNHAPDWAYYDLDRSTAFAAIRRDFANGWSGTAELSYSRLGYDGVTYYVDGLPDRLTGAGTSIVPVHWSGTEKQVALNAHASGNFTILGREHDLAFGISLADSNSSGPNWGGWRGSWTGYNGTIPNIFTYDGSGVAAPVFPRTGDRDDDEHQYSAYVNSRLNLSDKTKLFAGLRVVDWKRVSTTTTVAGTVSSVVQNPDPVIVPYIGLFHDLSDQVALYASYTGIFNPIAAGALDINGKPLDPDEGVSYELGAKFRLRDDSLMASVALFHTDQKKLSQWNQVNWVTLQGVVSKGVEAELTGQLADDWNIAASYTYTESENADGTRAIYTIPQHSVKIFSTYRLGGKWDGLTLGGGVTRQSANGYDTTNSALISQSSYAVANLMARYEFSDSLAATLHVNNLFDKNYLATSGTWGVYGEPRNVSLTLTSRF